MPALALAAALAVAFWLAWPRFVGVQVPAYAVARQDLVQTVVASGQVQSPNRVDIGAQVTGVVSQVPVTEGQQVAAGDVLIRLDDREARAAVELAEGQLAQAEARLAQIRNVQLPQARETLAQNEANLRTAEAALARAEQLRRNGFTTQAALDEARRARDVAQAQVRSADVQVASLSPGGREYVVAETQVAQANATLHTAQSRLAYTVIRAPVAGTLIGRAVERGWVVQPGRTLMTLSPAGAVEIVVQIDERNLGLIELGQSALVSADAYPGQTFEARLSYINPGVDPQRGSVLVRLEVPGPPAYLRQDMTVSVDIAVARRANAVVVPADAVREATGADPWVLKVVDGRAVRQPVVLGIRGTGAVEIRSGVDAGDLVIPSTADIVAGQRVRPQATPVRRSAARLAFDALVRP